ncbi:MAG: cytochrome c [Rubrivivax sp.]|nr:cytochrome c [Rubrivivax sp.]
MKRLFLAVTAVAGLAMSLPAAAQFQKPEDAIKYRQSAFQVMSAHFGRIGAMANGRVPFDAKVAQDNMAIVTVVHKLPFTAFGEGTDKGLPQRAKPEVWKEAAKFKAAGEKMQAEVAKLDAAVKAGNLDAIKAAFGAAGGSCKACHDDFRAEKYSSN